MKKINEFSFLSAMALVSLISCSDKQNTSNDQLLTENNYKGTVVGEDARAETVVKQSEEDREWWGKVNHTEIVNAVFDAVYSGRVSACDFLTGAPFTIDEVKKMESRVDTMFVENIETGQLDMKVAENKLNRGDIVKFFFKENWFFDKENFKFAKEVKAITLLTEKFSESGELLGHSPLFTVYFDKKHEPSGSEN